MTPTSADGPELLVDTSVAVALSTADHDARAACRVVVEGRRIGLAGHAAFETFSVLTRLPPPSRRTAAAVTRLLGANFPHTVFLDPDRAASLLERLPAAGLSGGSVYDALVGAAAVQAGVPLVSRDRRALGTYRALEVDVVLVG
ncbi:type II toxin-antitoxin system VapC family toxin [Pseudonocardia endophytica]|uniref:Ribonuclease VapC n=1 Tax=Pseudonocardia endophytica TaxID=401976 RepID=A0A4R1HX55_PSEEN|nr:type II toxin-antitoxin system VapC family toxin [Pseudonocardia endophytica]TCK25380.1 PIN domain-containing protein [Pseudonocardia endophytica]